MRCAQPGDRNSNPRASVRPGVGRFVRPPRRAVGKRRRKKEGSGGRESSRVEWSGVERSAQLALHATGPSSSVSRSTSLSVRRQVKRTHRRGDRITDFRTFRARVQLPRPRPYAYRRDRLLHSGVRGLVERGGNKTRRHESRSDRT